MQKYETRLNTLAHHITASAERSMQLGSLGCNASTNTQLFFRHAHNLTFAEVLSNTAEFTKFPRGCMIDLLTR